MTDLRNRLVMVPPDVHGDQRLLEHELEVRGVGAFGMRWEADAFGNRVCWVEAPRVEHAVDFEVRYRVERGAHPVERSDAGSAEAQLSVAVSGDTPGPRQGFCPAPDPYLQPTALTAPDERIAAAARAVASADEANEWAASALVYQAGVTGVQTPAAMALHLGRGVCQDYAHVLLALLREMGMPARYVSGHLVGEGAPHAWVEALLPEGVVAYDPTHRRRAGERYVTVAVGRDFADVSPTSGVFTGAARGSLSWSKEVEVEP